MIFPADYSNIRIFQQIAKLVILAILNNINPYVKVPNVNVDMNSLFT